MKLKILLISLVLIAGSAVFFSCNKDSDDNPGDEETCSDGILNQDELDIDCGGVCPPCDTGFSAKIGGMTWAAEILDINANGGTLVIYARNNVHPVWILNIVHKSEFTPGTYTLDASTYLTNLNGDMYAFVSGSITFTKFNSTTKTISGTFHYNTQGPDYPMAITEGKFDNIIYN